MTDLFKDWIPSINEKTKYMFDAESDHSELEKEYPAYMVNLALSQFKDTIQHAHIVNMFYDSLSPRMQYDFLYHGVPKKKRFGKWAKAETSDRIELIMKAYNYSRPKAEIVSSLLTDEDIENLTDYMNEGGKHGNKRK